MNCLEIMEFFRIQVVDGDFVVQSWPSLASLILCEVTISASDLHTLLLACPKLESFSLQSTNTFRRATLTLTSSTLKAFQFDSSTTRLVDRITLEAGFWRALIWRTAPSSILVLWAKGIYANWKSRMLTFLCWALDHTQAGWKCSMSAMLKSHGQD